MKKTIVAIGLCLGMSALLPSAVHAEKLIEQSSKGWKYSDKKEAPGKEWNSIEFDDSKWSDGQA